MQIWLSPLWTSMPIWPASPLVGVERGCALVGPRTHLRQARGQPLHPIYALLERAAGGLALPAAAEVRTPAKARPAGPHPEVPLDSGFVLPVLIADGNRGGRTAPAGVVLAPSLGQELSEQSLYVAYDRHGKEFHATSFVFEIESQ